MKFINSGITDPGTCPVCGSMDITYGNLTAGDDDWIYYPYKCNDCLTTGREIYDIAFNEMSAEELHDCEMKEINDAIKRESGIESK